MIREKATTDVMPASKTHYSLVDDGTIEKLRQYYNVQDDGEILRFVKKYGGSMRLNLESTNGLSKEDTGPP